MRMIRRATSSDVAAITGIYNQAIAEGGFTGDTVPVSIQHQEAWFADHQHRYAIFVAEDGGSVVGYVALSPYRKGRPAFSNTCELSYYISRNFRRRGLGKELVSHAIETATRSGFKVAVAILLGSNQASIRLLERFNFSECGRVPAAATIGNDFVDHLYMARPLDK